MERMRKRGGGERERREGGRVGEEEVDGLYTFSVTHSHTHSKAVMCISLSIINCRIHPSLLLHPISKALPILQYGIMILHEAVIYTVHC